MKRVSYKHLLAVRWFHWVNFPLLTLMMWSGLLILWANNAYASFGGTDARPAWKLLPDRWFDALGMDHRLADGMSWHFAVAWLFAVNGLLYVAYTVASGEWRYLVPDRKCWREAGLVVLHDLHLRKTQPPVRKYNAAQRISYTAIILMGGGSVLTGLAIYKPSQLHWLAASLGGYEWARWEHFWLTVGYVLFFLIHVGQVVKSGWNNFRSMITGYDVLPPEAVEPKEVADAAR